jgi:uncharacterized protein YkwD
VTPRRLPAGLVAPLVLFLLTGCTGTESAPPDPTAYAASLTDATNAARADEGLPPLDPSPCARDAAATRAAALAGADLTHAPMDAVLTGCDVGAAGENLSRSTLPADAVVDAWLGSAGHRANLLDGTWTHMGVACVADSDALLCSQVFLGR